MKRPASPTARGAAGGTTRVKLYLTYPSPLVREPLIYRLSRSFDLVFNIRQASVGEEIGIIAIELDGDADAIERGIRWLREHIEEDPANPRRIVTVHRPPSKSSRA